MRIQELFDLRGRTALITGGGSGLGYQMARGLAEAGSTVVIASRRLELCESRAEAIRRDLGVEAIGLKMDVTKEEDVNRAMDQTVSSYGHLDILVNNAGGVSIFKSIVEMTRDEWNSVMDGNMTGAFYCCRAAGRHMIPRRYGKIINIASIYGTFGVDGRLYRPGEEPVEHVVYGAAKGALVNFTRGLATAWARYKINVNCISPGGFVTEGVERYHGDWLKALETEWGKRTPLGRMGGEDDLKGAVVYLASEASRYVTGQNLIVDGGFTVW